MQPNNLLGADCRKILTHIEDCLQPLKQNVMLHDFLPLLYLDGRLASFLSETKIGARSQLLQHSIQRR